MWICIGWRHSPLAFLFGSCYTVAVFVVLALSAQRLIMVSGKANGGSGSRGPYGPIGGPYGPSGCTRGFIWGLCGPMPSGVQMAPLGST